MWREAADVALEAPARRVVCINTTYQITPWADVLYACDWQWWKRWALNASDVFKGEAWTVSEKAAKEYGVNWIRGEPGIGLCKREDTINTGQNSGFQCVGLAQKWGAAKIILLGYDFQRTGGRTHWHGDHPPGMANGGNFPMWAQQMGHMAKDLENIGLEVVNCSRQTALKCFPRGKLEEHLM